jgi:hypothetical protein
MNRRRQSCLALSILASTLGCGSGTETTPPFDGVQGTAIDHYELPLEADLPVPKTTWTSIAAESGGKSYPGTLDDKGTLQIPSVPEGPYMLALTSPEKHVPGAKDFVALYESSSRTLDLGTPRSHRSGLQPMTKSSYLIIDAPLAIPWHAYTDDGMGNVQPLDDVLQLFSRSTAVDGFFTSSIDPSMSPPKDGAKSLTGWRIDAFSASAYTELGVSQYSAAQHDDAAILHNVAVQVDEPAEASDSPWKSYQYDATQEAFQAKPFTLTDGGSVAIQGSFAPTTPKTFSLKYKGSAFKQLLADAPATPTSVSLYMDVQMEPGAPTPMEGADATLLEIFLFRSSYENPACDPAACDMMLCTTGCGSGKKAAFPGDYARDYVYGNPFDYGQEIFYASLSFSVDVSALLLETPFTDRLRGYYYVTMPVGEASGADIAPVISLPRQVTVNGKAAPADGITKGVGQAPVIAFQPPSLGKPDFYTIRAVQLDDEMDATSAVIGHRTVLSISTTSTSVTIPSGVLESGKHYSFEITAAVAPGRDSARPFAYNEHDARAQTFTGIVMP